MESVVTTDSVNGPVSYSTPPQLLSCSNSNFQERNIASASEDGVVYNRRRSLKPQNQAMSEFERHLNEMTLLLRPEDSIKLVVRLESVTNCHLRYLAVVSCFEQNTEEYCLLGIDCCKGHITLGLVLAILSHTTIRLDGDGGFCVTDGDGLRSHIFKPVSVQTMWSALQALYRASECAKNNNSFQIYAVKYYEQLFSVHKSDPACLSEWNTLPGVETRRPTISMSSNERSFQIKISSSLRDILLAEQDLNEVTSKEIRTKLEKILHVDLSNYKSFIDEEMLKILGQMEAPAEILEHLYLGTQWNASHQQELCDKEIGYILNVTAEIDNFFPDTFRYMNIPVNDNEETDLLRYFNDSYRFINEAHKDGKSVLVHCKMGISRSATIVIAYVMKERNWDLNRAIIHVKGRRTCVNPNPNFMNQLEVYEGLLKAKRRTQWDILEKRSKSESNLKRSDLLTTPSDIFLSRNDRATNASQKRFPRKYYNTAPARLKPEKYPNGTSNLSRPKSCSCAAFPSVDDQEVSDRSPSVISKDVLDSFQDAVHSLEQSTIPTNHATNASSHSRETYSNASAHDIAANEVQAVPVVMVNESQSQNFISTETVFLSVSQGKDMVVPDVNLVNVASDYALSPGKLPFKLSTTPSIFKS